MIFSDLKLSYNISDMGYDNSLSKIVFGTPDIPPEMSNVFTSGVAAQVLTSGELIGNLTVKEGYIQSFNFVSGSEGWRILYNGTAQFAELTLTGGTLKYKKTSFTDSTHAGYYIGSEGIYFGSISDATKLKYTIADGSFTITGALTTGAGSVIDGQYLGNLSVQTGALANLAITAAKIDNATITATQIANATITGTQIASATITGSNIGATTITAGNIVNATITATQIANSTITAGQIAAATITATQISATAGIIGGQIDNLTITAGNIANLTITAAQIANSTITGTQIASDTITGIKLKIGNQSWSHDLAFSSTDLNTVAWASGTITMADGSTTYAITGANTGDMAARTYIYLNIAVSTTLLQITTTAGTAVGDGKILIAVAQNSTTEAIFQVYGGIGGIAISGGDIENSSIAAAQIASGTITANEIAANTITAGQIAAATITGTEIAATTITAANIVAATITGTEIAATTIAAGNIVANTITAAQITAGTITATEITVANLSSLNANLGAITAGTITLPNTGWIKGGQTAYNTGTGFFLGYATDAYKFSIGNPAGNYMTWNGSAIEMSGKYLDTFTAGENIAAGNVVCLKNSSVTFNATADAEVWSANPTTNYGTSTVMYVGYDNAQSTYRHSLINFDLTTHPSNFQKATLYVYGILVGNMDYTSMRVRLINATWAEGTVTWNTKPTISSGAYGYVNYPTLSTSWSWHAFDVTEALRFAKNGTLNNYGFLFDTTGGTWPAENRYFTMKTKEETGNVGPYIVTLSNELCDEKVYKASQNDYNLSRNVIGFAYESKSTDESIKIQTAGKVSETAVAGTVLYLGNDGAFTTSTANLDRIIILGRGLTSSNLKMNISELDYIGSSRSVSKITGITTYYVAPPNDATKAIITMCNGSGLTLLQTTIYKAGKNDQELRTEANSAIEFNATATWGTNNITLSETLEFSASGYFSISFYNK